MLEPLTSASVDQDNLRRATNEPTGGRTLGSDQRYHPEGHTGRRSRRIAARGGEVRGAVGGERPRRRHYTRRNIAGGSFAGGRSRTSRATNITGGSLPGIIVCCIIAAPTEGAFALGRNSCGYACWCTAARFFLKRNANCRSNSAHLAAIITGPAISELRGLKLYTKRSLLDIAHETHGAESAVEYAYARTNVPKLFGGGEYGSDS